MEESIEIVRLLIAISRMAEGRRIRRGRVWYESQKEHWMDWLFNYNSPGAYARKVVHGRDAKFVYNHVVCPEMLTFLAEASGVDRRLVRQARSVLIRPISLMSKASEIRKIVPWNVVLGAMKSNGYLGATD